jgi:lincosamide and streptogramin A transport system ATP-binding/permease protein
MDEPTNHLDLEGKQVLADYLRSKKGFLVVSHDRKFIDDVSDHIISINKADIAIEKGNYTSWRMNKDRVEEYELRTKDKLEKDAEHLEKISVRTRNWASIAEKQKSPFATNNRGNSTRAARFMRQAKAAEQTIQENIAEKKNLLKNYEVASNIILKQQVIKENLLVAAYGLSYGYTKDLLFEKLSFQIHKGERVWIRGRNGAGKSTLLKIIGRMISDSRILFADHIKIETAFQEPLWTTGMLTELISDTEMKRRFIDICHLLDISHDTMQRPLETLSSGEQKKIDIARALASPSHLLLLDEPLNFCDICFREQLEKAILAYQPTIVFVEHDEWFGQNIATKEIILQ